MVEYILFCYKRGILAKYLSEWGLILAMFQDKHIIHVS